MTRYLRLLFLVTICAGITGILCQQEPRTVASR